MMVLLMVFSFIAGVLGVGIFYLKELCFQDFLIEENERLKKEIMILEKRLEHIEREGKRGVTGMTLTFLLYLVMSHAAVL